MSSQPPYPAAPAGYPAPPPGYPPGHPAPAPARPELARRQTILFILLFLLLVGLAFFWPPLLLLSGDRNPKPGHLYNGFREGGFAMWGILLCQMFVWAATAGLGALIIRGTRVPSSILFVLGLMPFGVGVLGAMAGAAKVSDALSGESVDPSQKARLLAIGTSEITHLFLYGGTVSAFAVYLAAVAAVLGLVTIDPAPLGPAPRGSGWIIGLPVAFGFVIVAIGARVALGVSLFVLDGLVVFGILTAGLLAAAGGRILPALIASGKEEEASRAFRQLLLAGVALAAAMLLSDRALLAASIRRPLGALGGHDLDVAQRLTILRVDLVPALRGRPVLMVLDAIGCLAAFAAPLAAARAVKNKISIAGVVAGVVATLTALLAFFGTSSLEATATSMHQPFEDLEKSLAANAITLPTGRGGDGSGTEALPGKPDLLVKKDGSPVDPANVGSDTTRAEVAADGSVTFEAFMSKAGASILKTGSSRRVAFALLPAQRVDTTPLGKVAGLLGTDLLSLPVTLHSKLAAGLPSVASGSSYSYGSKKKGTGVLAVLPDGDVGRLVAVQSPTVLVKLTDTMPLGDDSASREARKRVITLSRIGRFDPGMILLAPAPGDTLGHVIAQVQAIAASLEPSSSYRHDAELSMDLGITGDRAALEAAPAAADVVAPTPAVPTTRPTRRRPGR